MLIARRLGPVFLAGALLLVAAADAFYLPGGAPKSFQDGDKVRRMTMLFAYMSRGHSCDGRNSCGGGGGMVSPALSAVCSDCLPILCFVPLCPVFFSPLPVL